MARETLTLSSLSDASVVVGGRVRLCLCFSIELQPFQASLAHLHILNCHDMEAGEVRMIANRTLVLRPDPVEYRESWLSSSWSAMDKRNSRPSPSQLSSRYGVS